MAERVKVHIFIILDFLLQIRIKSGCLMYFAKAVESSYSNGHQEKTFLFGSPMLWREPSNHENDCYFCVTIIYAEVPSVTKTILHSKDLPYPVCPGNSSANTLDDEECDVVFKSSSSDSEEFSLQENTPH